jgi:glycerophosphoryl diester phosphodiesterase
MLLAPENTAAAFDLALHFQADVLETDVRLSRDGHVIVTHDARVDRTTDGGGAVRDMTLIELKKLDAGYRFFNLQGETYRGRGIQLLTLDELFTRYPQTGINIDIKDNDPAAATAVAEVIERHPQASWVNTGSFHAKCLRHFRRIAPTASTAALQDEVARLYFGGMRQRRASSRHADVARAATPADKLLAYRCLQIPVAWYGIPLATDSFIQQVQALGVAMIYWTINDSTAMRTLLQQGVDGIVTDRADLALTVFRNCGWKTGGE